MFPLSLSSVSSQVTVPCGYNKAGDTGVEPPSIHFGLYGFAHKLQVYRNKLWNCSGTFSFERDPVTDVALLSSTNNSMPVQHGFLCYL